MTRIDEHIRVVLEWSKDRNIVRRACAKESVQVLLLKWLLTVEHLANESDHVSYTSLIEISVKACNIAIGRHSPHSIRDLSRHKLGVVENDVFALILNFCSEVECDAFDWDEW